MAGSVQICYKEYVPKADNQVAEVYSVGIRALDWLGRLID
jgi:hypothetical protein